MADPAGNTHTRGQGSDPWIFREGRVVVSGKRLSRDIEASLSGLTAGNFDREKALAALLRFGELESALADIGWAQLETVIQVTNHLASLIWIWPSSESMPKMQDAARQLFRYDFPERLTLSPAEGFAYYALHPLDFANLALALAADLETAAVIGIRSIGTTLSALVNAALRANGRFSERITLRPEGHPYDRTTRFTASQLRWIEHHISRDAKFLVVDEGPGRSGSSFLSVGEALEDAGVPTSEIVFLGSRRVDPHELCARDAAERWRRFRFLTPEKTFDQQFAAYRYLGAGEWRQVFLENRSRWPPTWPQMERLKFLSPDRNWFLKFEGFGHYGAQVLDRARRLALSGFGASVVSAGDGFLGYSVVQGRPARYSDLSLRWLEHLASYCAFRAREFASAAAHDTQLPEMLSFNLIQEFGEEAALAAPTELLASGSWVLADGRMQPHEWMNRPDGRVFKTDACSHGDDHFFPGPTDPAWDLAGAIVEWNMDPSAQDFLIRRVRRLTGDNASQRLPVFQLAYTISRLAYCEMALGTVANSADEGLLRNACHSYRRMARLQLASLQSSCSVRDRLLQASPDDLSS